MVIALGQMNAYLLGKIKQNIFNDASKNHVFAFSRNPYNVKFFSYNSNDLPEKGRERSTEINFRQMRKMAEKVGASQISLNDPATRGNTRKVEQIQMNGASNIQFLELNDPLCGGLERKLQLREMLPQANEFPHLGISSIGETYTSKNNEWLRDWTLLLNTIPPEELTSSEVKVNMNILKYKKSLTEDELTQLLKLPPAALIKECLIYFKNNVSHGTVLQYKLRSKDWDGKVAMFRERYLPLAYGFSTYSALKGAATSSNIILEQRLATSMHYFKKTGKRVDTNLLDKVLRSTESPAGVYTDFAAIVKLGEISPSLTKFDTFHIFMDCEMDDIFGIMQLLKMISSKLDHSQYVVMIHIARDYSGRFNGKGVDVGYAFSLMYQQILEQLLQTYKNIHFGFYNAVVNIPGTIEHLDDEFFPNQDPNKLWSSLKGFEDYFETADIKSDYDKKMRAAVDTIIEDFCGEQGFEFTEECRAHFLQEAEIAAKAESDPEGHVFPFPKGMKAPFPLTLSAIRCFAG